MSRERALRKQALEREREALEQQTATAEILRVMSGSPSDVQPVFDAVARKTSELCSGNYAIVVRFDGELIHLVAQHNARPGARAPTAQHFPRPPGRNTSVGRAVLERAVVHVPHADKDPELSQEFVRRIEAGSFLAVPLIREGRPIGAIGVSRAESGPFPARQIELVKVFADQAVIAIENARLFNETKEALEQQTATAQILKVIAGSPADVQPVFDAILAAAMTLCHANMANVYTFDGELIHLAALVNRNPEYGEAIRQVFPRPPGRDTAVGRAVLVRDVVEIPDVLEDREYGILAQTLAGGFRSALAVPLIREKSPIGAIIIGGPEPGPFPEKQVALLKSFADQAVIAIENARLFNETKEALERQTASADVLRVIGSSPSDLQPVFDSILENAMRLCDASLATVGLYDGRQYRHVAQRGGSPEYVKFLFGGPFEPNPQYTLGRMIVERQPFHAPDYRELAGYKEGNPRSVATVEIGGTRTYLAVPMLKDGEVIGGITVRRTEVRPFTQKQIDLVRTFADQAVIAIENARLFNETKEALEQQTAISEILRVISDSPTNVQPVLEAVAARAARICDATDARISLVEGQTLRYAAGFGDIGVSGKRPLDRGTAHGRAVIDRTPVHVEDMQAQSDDDYPLGRRIARETGWRTVLAVPLLREGRSLGAIVLRRMEVRPFGDKQIALLQTFADQAAIAIENVRLFDETKEALERQTATADILKVISSSPTDVQPVFQAILENATRLCGAHLGFLSLYDGDKWQTVAHLGANPEFAEWIVGRGRFTPSPGAGLDQMLAKRAPVHIADYRETSAYRERYPMSIKLVELGGVRSYLAVPMLKDGRIVGGITVYRADVRMFEQKQIDLLSTFADQAVIAIENVRLFKELQATNANLREALEQQTATSELLKIIGRSSFDLGPVFETLAKNTVRLCEAERAYIFRFDGELLRVVATHNVPPNFRAWVEQNPIAPGRHSSAARTALERRTIHIHDVMADPEYTYGAKHVDPIRTVLTVPMLRAGELLGVLLTYRHEVRPFTDSQIALLETFADQAAIAIENARLFNETKEALERQTATSEILRVISGSPTDIAPVFEAILKSATELCGAHFGNLNLRDGEGFRTVAQRGANAEFAKHVSERGAFKPMGAFARMTVERQAVQVPDLREGDAYRAGQVEAVKWIEMSGARSFLAVPLLKEGQVIGGIAIYRPEVRPFTDQQIALVSTFADQAVIAIENVRLFNETKEALEQQTATGEILSVIARSPTNVQPVFDSIAQSCVQLFGGMNVTVTLARGESIELAAFATKEGLRAREQYDQLFPLPLNNESVSGRAILSGEVVYMADPQADGTLGERTKAFAQAIGYHNVLCAPMIRDGKGIGTINVMRGATETAPYTEKQIALFRAFANQAVIAIENARLFNETKEALEQQTATSNILGVISSSPTDLAPVFDAILGNATTLCDAHLGVLNLFDGEGFWTVAHRGTNPEFEKWVFERGRFKPEAFLVGLAGERKLVHIADIRDTPSYREGKPNAVKMADMAGARTFLAVPLVKESRVIGAISIYRPDVRLFTDKQIALVSTFANQAVIAIENVRLFNETKEALERQTATAEILKVISKSPSDIQPVFDAVAESAARLCDATDVIIRRIEDGGVLRAVTHIGSIPLPAEVVAMPVSPKSPVGRAVIERRTIHIHDVTDDSVRDRYPEAAFLAQRGTVFRTLLVVPLLREAHALGAITLRRMEVRPFTEKQISLLKTFADQAVIAIENARLFKELQERTEALTKSVNQLTALGEVGQAISSTLDLETVLKTIVSRAVQLTGLDAGGIYEYDEPTEQFHLRAAENISEEMLELLRRTPIRKGDGAVGSTAVAREPIQVPETQDESYKSQFRDLIIRTGRRALLAVPLMHEEHIVGALLVQRNTPGPFAQEVVDLLKTFATQSALAIQNARLFREIAEKGKQLEVASQHKSQFLASMSHELRTPLNAILGFNEMMLDGLCGEVPAGFKDPLDETQKSGKHLLRLINNVLDLAKIEAGRMELALADYSVHDTVESVRSTLRPLAAEKGLEFLANVPADIPLAYGDAGRITQCLMNLAGNSLKFTKEGRVEISVQQQNGQLRYCVADTGIGIPPESIGGLFTEFKQTDATIASEYGGTGLGLSITKKFIEMHGGRIWVESEIGKGSAFIFEIPLKLGK